MKKLLTITLWLLFFHVSAQQNWKQELHYDLQVKFTPTEKSLDGKLKILYVNHSPDTLKFIWFHLWPNAYRNDRTRYSDQLLENGDTRFYFSNKDQKGYLNHLDFRVNGLGVVTEDHPEYIDIVKLLLPGQLLPGDSVVITTPFHLRLPYNFNGYGYSSHHFELRNWYPEPAVYDSYGWHPMPYLIQGGAYHEIADFNVEIESPSEYAIAAGTRSDTVYRSKNITTLNFSLHNANAFAWVADNRFKLRKDTMDSKENGRILLQYFYTTDPLNQYKELFAQVRNNLSHLSGWLGAYPHQTLTLVQASELEDQNFTGLIPVNAKATLVRKNIYLQKNLIAQWFQTILMTDQRNQPWLSKGFIQYYHNRLNELSDSKNPGHIPFQTDLLWLRVAETEKSTQPIRTASPEFTTSNDSLIPATKAGIWLKQLKDTLGQMRFDRNMSTFIAYWKFGHPYPVNFEIAMDTNAGRNLKLEFDNLKNNASLFPVASKRTLKPAFIFSARNSERYNYIGIAPAAGYNKYDDFMLGGVIHNINLPANKFEFLLSPLYAFGSKQLVGLGRVGYTWHPDGHIDRITIGLSGAHFNTNKASDSTGKIIFENFSKLVPYLRFEFKPVNPRSTIAKWIEFSTYLINEVSFDQFAVSSKDSLIHPNATVKNFRYVNQLSLNLRDSRALYPYDLNIEFQQSELFYRINLHANYFLNYPDGGGLSVRFFAAKFGVWNSDNVSRISRYQPKLLGVDGDEDYLYQDYFIGRSASYALEKSSIPNQGFIAQQIMNRDGGLKLRIDDYDYLQGRSDNWVSALNFNTTLPEKLFPIPIPVRIFLDIGTYAEAWGNNPPTSHFLYTAGIQLSLFKNVMNIYAPLLYSNDFNAALGSTNFGRRITFSIDIQNIKYKRFIRKMLPAYE